METHLPEVNPKQQTQQETVVIERQPEMYSTPGYTAPALYNRCWLLLLLLPCNANRLVYRALAETCLPVQLTAAT
jgi:hypothetical protein